MTNDAAERVMGILRQAKRVLVVTHVRPDGDALGSCAALVLGLAKVNIPADVLLLSHLPRKYAFAFQENAIRWFDAEAGWPADLSWDAYDVLAAVDTGTWSQLPGLKERIGAFSGRKVVIDHHLTQEGWADAQWVATDAAAAGEIVAELLRRWPIEIDTPIAAALYLAIASDTGWFAFANTRPFTLRLAATLMERGVDTDRIYRLLFQNEEPQRVRLMARALAGLELRCGGRLAVMTIRRQDFADTGAGVPDTENLINVPLQVADVAVSALITEPVDFGPTRVSLRSKGQLDVARFAEQFGGGGHARAAGLKIDGEFAAARQRVIAALERAVFC